MNLIQRIKKFLGLDKPKGRPRIPMEKRLAIRGAPMHVSDAELARSLTSPTQPFTATVTTMESSTANDELSKFKAIARQLHERLACGCHREPCWNCQQVSRRYQAMIREDQRTIQAIHRHPSDSSIR